MRTESSDVVDDPYAYAGRATMTSYNAPDLLSGWVPLFVGCYVWEGDQA